MSAAPFAMSARVSSSARHAPPRSLSSVSRQCSCLPHSTAVCGITPSQPCMRKTPQISRGDVPPLLDTVTSTPSGDVAAVASRVAVASLVAVASRVAVASLVAVASRVAAAPVRSCAGVSYAAVGAMTPNTTWMQRPSCLTPWIKLEKMGGRGLVVSFAAKPLNVHGNSAAAAAAQIRMPETEPSAAASSLGDLAVRSRIPCRDGAPRAAPSQPPTTKAPTSAAESMRWLAAKV